MKNWGPVLKQQSLMLFLENQGLGLDKNVLEGLNWDQQEAMVRMKLSKS